MRGGPSDAILVVGLLPRDVSDIDEDRDKRRASAPLVMAPAGPLPFLYRDEDLVIVNKPSGLAAHRGHASERDNVLTRVRDAVGQYVYLVHRLDRATSGAIALVLRPELVEPLQRAFDAGEVEKRYLALTRGRVPSPLVVDYPIPRAEGAKERVPAITELRLLGLFERRYGLVEAVPRTGRYHQIRRHLAHLRCPVLGDTNYGDRTENKLFRTRFMLMRLALHAHSLSVPHPVTGARIRVEAPMPEDLAGPLAAMNLWPPNLLLTQPEISST